MRELKIMTNFVIIIFVMTNFGTFLKNSRRQSRLRLREVASRAELDSSLLSRYENGDRFPPEKSLSRLSAAYGIPHTQMRVAWLAEQVLSLVGEDPAGYEALHVAESRIAYLQQEARLARASQDPNVLPLIQKVDALQDRWQQCHPLDKIQLERMNAWYRTLYTWESNRIEGNTLTLQETELVVNQGLTIGGKTMREHLEAINHAQAVDYLLELVKSEEVFSPRILRELHSLILRGIAPEHAGRYRQVPVRISGSHHTPPQPWELEGLMDDYFTFFHREEHRMHPVLLAAEMHERLVTIHPFIDGNGRTSRLIMNLILLRNGYTLVNLKGDPESRMKYYKALEAVQTENDPEVFHTLILRHAIQSLEDHLALT